MGHAGERSRGDSRLRDWPDVECRLVRDESNDEDGDTDPAARYLAAYRRDVDQPEQLLGYDGTTRRLTIAGGSRKDTKVEALIAAVVQYVTGGPGCSQNAIEKAEATESAPESHRPGCRAWPRPPRGSRKQVGSHPHLAHSPRLARANGRTVR